MVSNSESDAEYQKLLKLTRVFKTPEFECIVIDPLTRKVELVERKREDYTNIGRTEGKGSFWIQLDGLIDIAKRDNPKVSFDVFICQPYTASTLLVRAAGELPGTLAYAESTVILNLSHDLHAADTKEVRWDEIFDVAARLVSRTYSKKEKVVIKEFAANCKPIFEISKRWNDQINAVIMLGDFVGFYPQAKKKVDRDVYLTRRLERPGFWTREIADFIAEELPGMSVDERIATYWYFSRHTCSKWLAERKNSAYVDVDTFLSKPFETLTAIGGFFGRQWKEEDVRRVVGGPLFKTHAKFDGAFTVNDRKRELEQLMAANRDGYQTALKYIEKISARFPIDEKVFKKLVE